MELTKGTWKKRRSATGSWVIDTDGDLIAKDIRECNADAIAAVPELVEACEAAWRWYYYGVKGDYKIIGSVLKVALAKARGEQQDVQA